jgi:hypothetical protein
MGRRLDSEVPALYISFVGRDTPMNRIEIQRALYNARNAYLKAKKEMEFQQREIAFLKECERAMNRAESGVTLYDELYSA